MHEASTSQKGIWKLAKWAVNSSSAPPPLPQFPKLEKANRSLTGVFNKQVEILCNKFFPEPLNADLSDIEGFQYPEPFPEKEFIDREGIRHAIFSLGLQKAPGPTGINNIALRLAYRVLED